MIQQDNASRLLDLEPEVGSFMADALAGLQSNPKSLPCKYFYDARGSELFEQICELEEYYPTRTELQILKARLPEISAKLGPNCMVIEYGTGSGVKTGLLLESLVDPVAYVPVDISREALMQSVEALAERFTDLELMPICADFTQEIEIPEPPRGAERHVVFFPGSTIGNLTHDEAVEFLRGCARLCGRGGAVLLGVDLVKNPAILEAAYDDAAGVTAEFNRNLLHRMNRELGADFDVDAFAHEAVYNAAAGRIEMYLRSERDTEVSIDGRTLSFTAGEMVHTESSHKYTPEGFRALARRAGLTPEGYWADSDRLFSVQLYGVD
jgi:dimethylhistidine N-methyltransferase